MLRLPTTEQAETLRTELSAAGFTEAQLMERFGTASAVALDSELEETFRYLTRRRDAIDVLTWLLLLGRPVARSETRVLSPDLMNCCETLELIRVDGELVSPTCLLARHGDLLLASDLHPKAGDPAYDHVLSTSPAARHLSNFVVERPGARVLDVCGGGGVQGLLAASWAREVWITDISERAIEYARRNAALNGLENCVFKVGSGFDPAAGEKFDAIICNPPFVVTPGQDVVALGNEMELDGFSRAMARGAPELLVSGGTFQMIFEWTERAGEPWEERLSGWLEDLGCDAWVLKAYSRRPHDYAIFRMQELHRGVGMDDSAFEEWIAYYDDRGVSAIHGGVMLLRETSHRSWLRFDEVEDLPTEPFGNAVRESVERFDALVPGDTDAGLLGIRFALAPEARLETTFANQEANWFPTEMHLKTISGLPRIQSIAPPIADFIGRLDGVATLGEHLDALIARLDSDPKDIRADCLRIVRHLANRGFLIPCPDP